MTATKGQLYTNGDTDQTVVVFGIQGGKVRYSPEPTQAPDFAKGQEFSLSIEDFNTVFSRSDTIVAPVFTSVDAVEVDENVALAHTLTATGPNITFAITGGADEAEFDLTGATLTWAADGTQDFETPGDANTDNDYVVIVTATDEFDNETDQTITVTVADVVEP